MNSSKRAIAGPDQARRGLRTVRDLIRYACSRFGAAGLSHGHGTGSAWDEAVYLVLWSLHLEPDSLEPWLDARLTPVERKAIIALIERRCAERVPIAYLCGEAWLRGMRFLCDSRALVPRSLIAEALEESLPAWLDTVDRHSDWPRSVLDLCTGGASLAILAAQHFPLARVSASDASSDALELARENLALHGLARRVRLAQGDLFAALGRARFDLILCNPPYVNEASMNRLPDEFKAEPRCALAGGVDGMDLIRRIIAGAPAHLNKTGLLLLEIGHEAQYFEAAFPRLEFTYLPVSAGERMLVLLERRQLAALA